MKNWTYVVKRPPLRVLMKGPAVIGIVRDMEHPPGTQTPEENQARWERFRWNYMGALQEKLDSLPAPAESDYARKLALRLERLRSMQ